MSELNVLSPYHYGVGVSGFSNYDVLRGRPCGGWAILWRRDIQANEQIVTKDSRRVSALHVDFGAVKLLFINVCLPHEDSEAYLYEFSFQLSIVNNVIEMHQKCENFVGGDFNVGFSRNWSHTDLLNEFCNRTNLYPFIKHVCSSIILLGSLVLMCWIISLFLGDYL